MLSVAILSGGKSEPMGRDKALLPFLGRPLILRILERLQSLSNEVFVTTDRRKIMHSLAFRSIQTSSVADASWAAWPARCMRQKIRS